MRRGTAWWYSARNSNSLVDVERPQPAASDSPVSAWQGDAGAKRKQETVGLPCPLQYLRTGRAAAPAPRDDPSRPSRPARPARPIFAMTLLRAAAAFVRTCAAPGLTRRGPRNGAIWREPRSSLGCGLFLILGPALADTTITVVHTRVGPLEKTVPQARPGKVF
jgi:hypothetical protein